MNETKPDGKPFLRIKLRCGCGSSLFVELCAKLGERP
jgi:hypothetical protein